MPDNVRPIRRNSLSKQASLAKRLVAMAESTLPLAKTQDQADRIQARIDDMRHRAEGMIRRARDLEGYDG